MNHLFLPYDLAVIAKEKGFNEPCIAEYIDDGIFSIHSQSSLQADPSTNDQFNTYTNDEPNWNAYHFKCSAPMYQQIVDWFREKHNIDICYPILKKKDLGIFYGGYIKKNEWEFGKSYGSNFTNYYEALNKAIEKALELI